MAAKRQDYNDNVRTVAAAAAVAAWLDLASHNVREMHVHGMDSGCTTIPLLNHIVCVDVPALEASASPSVDLSL